MKKIKEIFNLLETLLKHKVTFKLLVLIVLAIISSEFNEVSISNCETEEKINSNENENQKAKWSWVDIGLILGVITMTLALIWIAKEFLESTEKPVDDSPQISSESDTEISVILESNKDIIEIINHYDLSNLIEPLHQQPITRIMQEYIQIVGYLAKGNSVDPNMMMYNSLASHLSPPYATDPNITIFFDTLAKRVPFFKSLDAGIKAFQTMANQGEFTGDTLNDCNTFKATRQIFLDKYHKG